VSSGDPQPSPSIASVVSFQLKRMSRIGRSGAGSGACVLRKTLMRASRMPRGDAGV
jgi:hypothetical protein